MVEKKQLNVRIPLELQEKIENDGRSKVDVVVEALELYFDSKKHLDDSKNDTLGNSNDSKNDTSDNSKASMNIQGNSNDSKKDMLGNSSASKNDMSDDSNASKNDNCINKFETIENDGIARMKTEIEYLRSKVDDMIKLLHQEQVLHIQTQHMLTAPPQSMKKWWQFWR